MSVKQSTGGLQDAINTIEKALGTKVDLNCLTEHMNSANLSFKKLDKQRA